MLHLHVLRESFAEGRIPDHGCNETTGRLTCSRGGRGRRPHLSPALLAHGGRVCLRGRRLELELFGEEVIYRLCEEERAVEVEITATHCHKWQQTGFRELLTDISSILPFAPFEPVPNVTPSFKCRTTNASKCRWWLKKTNF